MILLLVPSALAAPNRETISFFDALNNPVTEVRMLALKCADTNNECRTVEGILPVFSGFSGTSNMINAELPSTQRPTDYAQYFTKSGFLPMRNVAFDLQANQRFTYSVNFVKKAQCEANVGVIHSPLIVIQQGQTFSVAADILSAFSPSGNAPFHIPDRLKDEFYSTHTDVVLTLRNAANPAVTASVIRHVNPLAGTFGQALFNDLQSLQLPPGTYNGEIATTVVDDQCATTAVKTAQIRPIVINAVPVITITPADPFTIPEQQTLVFRADVTDTEGDVVTLSANLPEGATLDNQGVFRWTPTFAQSGTYNVVFTATDTQGGVATRTVTINVENVPSAPRITSTPITTAVVGMQYNYDVEAVDDEGKPITFSLAQAPGGMIINPSTGLIQWIPTTAQIGQNNVEVRATDTISGSNAQVFSVNVVEGSTGNNNPVIAPIGNQQVTEAQTLTFTVSASDADNDAITLTVSGLPQGASFVSNQFGNTFTWTPSLTQSGAYQITFTATDARGGSAQQTITIAVLDSTQPQNDFLCNPSNPVVNVPVTCIAQSTRTGTLAWNFGDPASGLQNIASGQVATHTFKTTGTYTVSLTITDASGVHTVVKVITVGQGTDSSQRDRVVFSRVNMPEIVTAGEQLPVRIEVFNDGKSLRDTKLTVTQYELGIRQSIGPFDISANGQGSKTLYVWIPEDAPKGEYDMEIRLSNDNKHRVIYRTIRVD